MKTNNIHRTYTRKRIDLKLPQVVLDVIDNMCSQKAITRTNYIETLIRLDLKKRNINVGAKEEKDFGTFEDWGWNESKKLRKVI